jgi:VWFA-related protein
MRRFLRTSLWIGLISLFQPRNVDPQEQENLRIRVGVEEVRVDAVVVDSKGRQVTDLTADDFEISQDGQPQKIAASTYIKIGTTVPEKPGVQAEPPVKGTTPSPQSARDANHRTILFLVDDLSMEMPEIQSARMSLQKFVERQMLPSDLVAIMQTTGGNAGMQPFSSDKRQLLSRISKIRWNPVLHPPDYFEDKDPLDPMQQMMPEIMAVDYTLRTLGDVPGRKYLMLLSTRVMLPDKVSGNPMFDALADKALRMGVVIHTLDIIGLINDSAARDEYGKAIRPLDASVGEGTLGGPLILSEAVRRQMSIAASRRKNRPVPLSQKTGGLFLTGNNFFVNGIGDANEEMKGYYLLSYVPPEKTFGSNNPNAYHKVKVKVKRQGCEIHTRDGFYGTLQTSRPQIAANTLGDAMFSPFLHHDLALDLSAGYAYDPQRGYLLRAWLHLDGRNLKIAMDKSGNGSVSLDAIATTSDMEGLDQNFGKTQIALRVNERDIKWIQENGIKFSISIPSRKPGAHYIRAAVKDQASGAIGSAYQFMEIPDLKNGRMELSSIFILNQKEDIAWIQSEESARQGATELTKQAPRRSQAMRSYLPGEDFECMAFVYNAKKADGGKPNLEVQSVLYSNGAEMYRSKPEAVDIANNADLERIPVRKQLRLERTIQPGNYLLQLIVTDKGAEKGNERVAAQTMDFEITAKTTGNENLLAAYEKATSAKKTVLEMTPEELRQSYPSEFSGVKFDLNQDSLGFLLKQAGEKVVSFFQDFANTSAKEQVRLQRYPQRIPPPQRRFQPALLQLNQLNSLPPAVDASGRKAVTLFGPTVSLKERSAEFSYLILTNSRDIGQTFIEDRKDKNGRALDPKELAGFITSSGHAGKSTYLHPAHQKNANFRYLGRDESKHGAYIIGFAQKPEAEDYLAQYTDANGSPPIRFLVEGLVWLDPDTFQILRMRTDMLEPEISSALRETITDIRYEKVRFERGGQEFWLPKEINVSWEFMNPEGWLWVYRNQHTYSDYHLFTVKSDYTISPTK